MDAEKIIKLKSNDNVVVKLSSKAASRSGLLKGVIEDYPEDSEYPLNDVDGKTLEKVYEYLKHYQDEEPQIIPKPLKSNIFEECANEWDIKFLGDNIDTVLALIRAANYMDIKPLLELAAAKLACKLGSITESVNIKKDFGITELNKEEREQFTKDVNYLKNNP